MEWKTYERFNAAGKNFASFDDRFLRSDMPDFVQYFRYHCRVLDPAILYWKPLEDTKLPDTKTCMERAGLDDEVAHTALEDAKVIIKLIQIAVGRVVDPVTLACVLTQRDQIS